MCVHQGKARERKQQAFECGELRLSSCLTLPLSPPSHTAPSPRRGVWARSARWRSVPCWLCCWWSPPWWTCSHALWKTRCVCVCVCGCNCGCACVYITPHPSHLTYAQDDVATSVSTSRPSRYVQRTRCYCCFDLFTAIAPFCTRARSVCLSLSLSLFSHLTHTQNRFGRRHCVRVRATAALSPLGRRHTPRARTHPAAVCVCVCVCVRVCCVE